MNRMLGSINSVKRYIVKVPFIVALFIAMIGFVGYMLTEAIRSTNYRVSVEEYKQSEVVQNTLVAIDDIGRAAETGDTSLFCDINLSVILSGAEETIIKNSMDSISQNKSDLVSKMPRFSSAAVLVPSVVESRTLSGEIDAALQEITVLAQENNQSEYCYRVSQVLRRASFLDELATVEGVSALFVNQIENFWVNIEDVQTDFKSMTRVPADFAENHVAIGDSLDELKQLMRGDRSNAAVFSKDIDSELAKLEMTLDDMKQKTVRLQEIPDKLQLLSATLRTP